MLESGRNLNMWVESAGSLLYEQYLPGVFQYVSYWVNDITAAEELTLKSLKEALVKYSICYKDEREFSIRIFSCARKEIRHCLKEGTVKPILLGLSDLEQDVISLRLAAVLNNQMISELLGLSESQVGMIIHQSLHKLRKNREVLS